MVSDGYDPCDREEEALLLGLGDPKSPGFRDRALESGDLRRDQESDARLNGGQGGE